MQSIIVEIGLDCRSETPVNNVVSATCGKGGWHVFKALEALAAIRGGEEEGERRGSRFETRHAHVGNRERTCTLTRLDPHTDGNSRAAMGSHWKVPRMRVNVAERCSKMEWASSSGGMQG